MNFKKSLKSVATFVLGAGMALNSMFVAPRIKAGIPKDFYDKLSEYYQNQPLCLSKLLLAVYMTNTPAEYRATVFALKERLNEEKERYQNEKDRLLTEDLNQEDKEILEHLGLPMETADKLVQQLLENLTTTPDPDADLQTCLTAITDLRTKVEEQLKGYKQHVSDLEENKRELTGALGKTEREYKLKKDLLDHQLDIAKKLSICQFQGNTECLKGIGEMLEQLNCKVGAQTETTREYHKTIVNSVITSLQETDERLTYRDLINDYRGTGNEELAEQLLEILKNYITTEQAQGK